MGRNCPVTMIRGERDRFYTRPPILDEWPALPASLSSRNRRSRPSGLPTKTSKLLRGFVGRRAGEAQTIAGVWPAPESGLNEQFRYYTTLRGNVVVPRKATGRQGVVGVSVARFSTPSVSPPRLGETERGLKTLLLAAPPVFTHPYGSTRIPGTFSRTR